MQNAGRARADDTRLWIVREDRLETSARTRHRGDPMKGVMALEQDKRPGLLLQLDNAVTAAVQDGLHSVEVLVLRGADEGNVLELTALLGRLEKQRDVNFVGVEVPLLSPTFI